VRKVKKGQEADPLTANPESIEFATTQLRELMRWKGSSYFLQNW